jgi:hypothetical protein
MPIGKPPGQEALQRMQQQQLQIQQDNMKKYWWWKRNKERERLKQMSLRPAGEKTKSWETRKSPHNYPVSQPKSRWFLGSLVFLVGAWLSFRAGRNGNHLILLVGVVITIIISRKVWGGKKR